MGPVPAWLLLSVLYIVAGILTFENRQLAAALLTLALGAALVAFGIMRILLASVGSALQRDHLPAWPRDVVASLYALGTFLGIDLIVAGAGWIGIGFGLTFIS
jgi:uncharacterized membrane protein HdeD (DUF308 family)